MHYKTLFIFFLFISLNICSQNLDSVFVSKKEISKSIGNEKEKLIFLYNSGLYFYSKKIAHAEYFFKQVLLILKDDENTMKANTLLKIGLIEKKKGDLGTSLRYLTNAKEIFKKINNFESYVSIHFDIGTIYRYKNQEDKELEFYKKGLELSKGLKGKVIAKSHLHFGNYYTRHNKLDSSVYCYDKALEIYKSLKNNDKIHNVNNNLANTYYKQGKYQKAINARNIILKYANASNNKMLLTTNYHNMAASYSKLKEYNIALTYIDSAISIAKKENFKVRLAKSYNTKAKINYKLKNYKQAYKYFSIHKIYSDSILGSQSSNQIKEVELNKKFEIEKRDLQLENQKQVFEKKIQLVIFSIFILLSIPFIIFLYRNSVKKSEKIKGRLEKEKRKKEVLSEKFKTSESELKKLVADNSMRLEFLKQLLKQLKEHKKITDSTEVKEYIRDLSLKIQQQISTESKLTLLKEKITSVNENFDNNLISVYSELTKTEREVCALLRLNLSIKEIATIRNSSIDAVKSIRYRIRKKMNIPKNKKLEEFIQNMKI